MEKVARRRVGRPIQKEGRIKIGLSIDGNSNIILDNLVKRTGKTKSRIFEEAIKLMEQREKEIYRRMLEYEKFGNKLIVPKETAIAELKKGM